MDQDMIQLCEEKMMQEMFEIWAFMQMVVLDFLDLKPVELQMAQMGKYVLIQLLVILQLHVSMGLSETTLQNSVKEKITQVE